MINKKTLFSITPDARRYAVKELARRAGVSQEFFKKWVIEIAPDRTIISFGAESTNKIYFIHATNNTFERILSGGPIPVASAGWLKEPPDRITASDLILPFCECDESSNAPLYQSIDTKSLTCRLDLLASFLFTLSRVEEILCDALDEHARFPASASLAFRHEFLERPILDEHGLAFQQVLSFLFPTWQPQPRTLRFKLTHDIDDIGIPFAFRVSIGHSLKRRNPGATLRDLLSQVTKIEPSELALVKELADISTARGLHSAFFWKASPASPHDSGYDPAQKKVQRILDLLRERGFELGVHPGYETFGDRNKLASEAEYLREALHVSSPGGRQHYLRWSPDTWLDWEACGLSYDSSLGFADRFGFRAGTAFPYCPWSWDENRELDLIEVPLILMDCTAVKYMKLNKSAGLERVKALIQRTAHTGGVFTLLWHNTPLLDPDYSGWYPAILDLLSGAQHFRVPTRNERLW